MQGCGFPHQLCQPLVRLYPDRYYARTMVRDHQCDLLEQTFEFEEFGADHDRWMDLFYYYGIAAAPRHEQLLIDEVSTYIL